MFPVLFRIGTFELTSFGAMMAVAALVGVWIFRRELRRSTLPETAVDAAVAGILGGLAGAKLLWVAEHLHEEPVLQLLFSRGGLSWFGGLVGGIGAGLAVMAWRQLPIVRVLSAASGAFSSATTTADRATFRGLWRSREDCRQRPCECTRRSSTKPRCSCPSPGCCSDGGAKARTTGS